MDNYNKKKAIKTIKEADTLLLNTDDQNKIDYSIKSSNEIVIELMATLKLANRQIKHLNNRVDFLTNRIETLTGCKY